LAGQQIIWSSTKNGASTGESNDYYGQNLDGNSSWTGAANRTWNVSDIGTWTKSVSIFQNNKIVATSQPATFTVRDCSSTITIPSTVALSITSFCIGQIPTYTVQASTDLANQQIAWSSTKNGVSTGEVNSNYGQVLNSNG
jgi:hypothetical protein